MTERWKHRPPGSNWGEFGADDQLGRLNLITDEKVLQGAAEVRVGRRFCLSLPLDLPGGRSLNARRFPPRHFATLRDGDQNFNYRMDRHAEQLTDAICDDAVLLCMQYSTQWDSLAHVGSAFDADGDGVAETVYYNGWRGGEHIRGAPAATGDDEFTRYEGVRATRLGIENMAATGVQGRAVMVDLHAHFGADRHLVGHADLMAVMAADGVVVEPGDMLCLHTGYGQAMVDMGGTPDVEVLHNAYAVLDGRDGALLDWIRDSGLAVLIADNYAVEQAPGRAPVDASCRHASLPLHELCLFKLGIHLGELWYLSELNAWLRNHRRSRFLLTAPPLRLPGAVGSPATPVATV